MKTGSDGISSRIIKLGTHISNNWRKKLIVLEGQTRKGNFTITKQDKSGTSWARIIKPGTHIQSS